MLGIYWEKNLVPSTLGHPSVVEDAGSGNLQERRSTEPLHRLLLASLESSLTVV